MKLIFLTGSTETLEYFSLQLAKYFTDLGEEVFLWDMKHPVSSRENFENLSDKGDFCLITFNFIGLQGEGQFDLGLINLWDKYGIRKINIMVDSPIYYYRQLHSHIRNMKLVCIDRNHKSFAEHFYPEYGNAEFIPLAGNRMLCDIFKGSGLQNKNSLSYLPFAKRPIADRPADVVFIGNYVTVQSLEPSLVNLGSDYKEYIYAIAEDLLKHPDKPIETALIESLKSTFPDSTDEEYLQACFQMVFIDLYVRTAYRGRIVTGLADAGIKVFCTGKDWDKAPCSHPENIIHTGESVVSSQCLEALFLAKISLNVMPWFKAGAHDRIFSSMLAGCVSLTDSSEYLDEIMKDGREFVNYKLGNTAETAAEAAAKAAELLKNPGLLQEIADFGYDFATKNHTWDNRGAQLYKIAEKSKNIS